MSRSGELRLSKPKLENYNFRMLIKLLIILSFLPGMALASPTSICGPDDRVLHQDSRIGRLGKPGVLQRCTVTMISKKCALTAGHCINLTYHAEFNTPPSVGGIPSASLPEDIYEVDRSKTEFRDRTLGLDWAVLSFKPNQITQRFPGEVYGSFPVAQNLPEVGDAISISGYGRDHRFSGERNFTLQTSEGSIISLHSPIFEALISHNVDSQSGNSGSSIIRVQDQQIIGIHTHSGCDASGRTNSGSLILGEPDLMAAINRCLNQAE